MDRPYQVMPPLSPEEYAALKADIATRGVQIPVEYDDDGYILDGFHRVQICEELGIDYPKIVRTGLTEGQRLEHAWRLNLARRHLSREQKQAIAAKLRQEGWTQERIAQTLCVSQATISMWLVEFINSDKLTTANRIEGKDGKRYPTRKPRQPAPQRTAKTDKTGGADRTAGVPLQEPTLPGQSSALGEIIPTLLSTEGEQPTHEQQPLVEPDINHQVIESTLETLTEGLGSPLVTQWLRLLCELYAELLSTEDQQDVMTIGQSWNQQMSEEYLHRCTYVISRLQIMRQALEQRIAQGIQALHAENMSHERRNPSDDRATYDDRGGEPAEVMPSVPERIREASSNTLAVTRSGARKRAVVSSPSMDSEETEHGDASRVAIDTTVSTRTVEEMTSAEAARDEGARRVLFEQIFEEFLAGERPNRQKAAEAVRRLNQAGFRPFNGAQKWAMNSFYRALKERKGLAAGASGGGDEARADHA